MNASETIDLLKLIRGYNPSFQAAPETPAVWARSLADVPAEVATDVVHEHFAMTGPWITVADIRRRAADRFGLIPPDPEAAYAQAVEFRVWLKHRQGAEPQIHPAALEAARTIGWTSFETYEGAAHKRFVTAYATTQRKAERELATTPFATLLARAEGPKALPGGMAVAEPKPPATDPAGVARLDKMIGNVIGQISVDGDRR